MPRKPKINREMVDEILTYKENGISDKDICDMVGIHQSTFYDWLKEAETGKDSHNPNRKAPCLELKVELADGLKKAQAAFKAYHIQNITKASKRNWQASAWMLERMYPKEFGRIDRQIALMGEVQRESGMLGEILEYLGMVSGEDVHTD